MVNAGRAASPVVRTHAWDLLLHMLHSLRYGPTLRVRHKSACSFNRNLRQLYALCAACYKAPPRGRSAFLIHLLLCQLWPSTSVEVHLSLPHTSEMFDDHGPVCMTRNVETLQLIFFNCDYILYILYRQSVYYYLDCVCYSRLLFIV